MTTINGNASLYINPYGAKTVFKSDKTLSFGCRERSLGDQVTALSLATLLNGSYVDHQVLPPLDYVLHFQHDHGAHSSSGHGHGNRHNDEVEEELPELRRVQSSGGLAGGSSPLGPEGGEGPLNNLPVTSTVEGTGRRKRKNIIVGNYNRFRNSGKIPRKLCEAVNNTVKSTNNQVGYFMASREIPFSEVYLQSFKGVEGPGLAGREVVQVNPQPQLIAGVHSLEVQPQLINSGDLAKYEIPSDFTGF